MQKLISQKNRRDWPGKIPVCQMLILLAIAQTASVYWDLLQTGSKKAAVTTFFTKQHQQLVIKKHLEDPEKKYLATAKWNAESKHETEKAP